MRGDIGHDSHEDRVGRNVTPPVGRPGDKAEASRLAEPREIARQYVAIFVNPTLNSIHQELLNAKAKSARHHGDAINLALVELLQDSDAFTRLGAATALLLTRRADAKAVSAFVHILQGDDSDLRFRALTFLALLDRIPEALKPSLVTLLEDNDRLVQVAAAAALRDLPESFSVLREALHAENPGLVMIAASALERSGRWINQAVRALVIQLERAESPEIGNGIVCLLSGMKEGAAQAGPVLLNLLADPTTEPGMRKAILLALGEMSLGDEAEAALMDAVRSGDPATVCVAAHSLKDLGVIPEELITVLSGMLESLDVDDRSNAVWMLGELGSQAVEAIPALIDLLMAEADNALCQTIANVIGTIGPSALEGRDAFKEHAVSALIVRARKERRLDMIRMFAAVIASFKQSAIPGLLELARSGDVDVRISVAALAKMGEEAAVVVAETLLTDSDSQVREVGAATLAEMGPQARPAMPTLIRLLVEGDEDTLPDVLRALRMLGPEASGAAAPLVNLLLETNPFVSTWAASALLAIGPGAAEALREALADANAEEQGRIKAILDQTGVPLSGADGIEVIRDQALRIKEQLETFQRIGEICKARGNDRFSFTEMERQLGIEDSTIGNHLDYVSEFFRAYFAKFEGLLGIPDDREPAEKSRKILDRGKGKRPSICFPLGWRAWELTDRFLLKQDEKIASRRRKPRTK